MDEFKLVMVSVTNARAGRYTTMTDFVLVRRSDFLEKGGAHVSRSHIDDLCEKADIRKGDCFSIGGRP